MKVTDEMIEAGCRAMHELQGTKGADDPLHHPAQNSWEEPSMKHWQQWEETVREILEAGLTHAAEPPFDEEERRERILETVAFPDNGTHDEVLSAILICANAWVPEARIIGNVRAGDIARVVSEILVASDRRIDPRHFNILAEAMAEVKATSDGLSDQPIADIVAGCLEEIAVLTVVDNPEA